MDLVRQWMSELDRPAVLDADALWAYQGDYDALAAQPAPRVLTPHSGELGALLGEPAAVIDRDRERILLSAVRKDVVLLHKGAPTEVIGEGSHLFTIAGGHPSMARGGTGDVLTGLLGGLLAQMPGEGLGMALLGAWLHAEAGCRAARVQGRGLHSADIIDFIPEVWNLLATEDMDPEPWP
jgi:NAD(P)H-hydrate epimerase